ncbi:hypothetical protein [Hymenobacter wooponensis]|uniref:Uncharacterized protein n=1 Tax=Hymenobacter wooponensis TaxID=1525360 RepID=A0A4Z0MNI6_9BACT|nr:hypothetical protein [Hymenobacter wooponensis]TGD80755.1 hypothetical protein EU557_13160 [Hymenobacter wooponensis]
MSRPLLGTYLQDATPNPLVFEFQRNASNAHPAYISITRSAWQVLGPSQAVKYIVDRYLIEHPEEEQRVGRGLVLYGVRYTLGFADKE